MPVPDDWDDAVSILRRLHGGHFAALGGADWAALARAPYRESDGRPAQDYDPALRGALDGVDFDRPMPSLWNEYRALAEVSCLVLRGANADILSDATLQAMKAAHRRLQTVTVPGQGHPPLLRGHALLESVAGFVRMVEDNDRRRGAGGR
jgi:hypothetical protein